MSEGIRRLYNRVDRALDRRALRGPLRHEEPIEGSSPLTARRVYDLAMRWARSLDTRARCHSMSAGHEDLHHDGSAREWVFLFDLPQRRATAIVEVGIVSDEMADESGDCASAARFQAAATPVLRPGSALDTMVRDGKLLYAAACAQAARDMESRRALPGEFRDSPDVCTELEAQGLDLTQVEASLTVAWRAGIPVWVATDRTGAEWIVPFRSDVR